MGDRDPHSSENLTSVLYRTSTQLDDDCLPTLFTETASIMNSRPLTVDNLNDPASLSPITPNHLLTRDQQLLCYHPDRLCKLTYTARRDGDESSCSQTSSEVAGRKNYCKLCNSVRSGQVSNGTWLMVILLSSRKMTHPKGIGNSEGLKSVIQAQIESLGVWRLP